MHAAGGSSQCCGAYGAARSGSYYTHRYVSMRQHTHTSAYAIIGQHTSAYVSAVRLLDAWVLNLLALLVEKYTY
jgi:hypothetical protein